MLPLHFNPSLVLSIVCSSVRVSRITDIALSWQWRWNERRMCWKNFEETSFHKKEGKWKEQKQLFIIQHELRRVVKELHKLDLNLIFLRTLQHILFEGTLNTHLPLSNKPNPTWTISSAPRMIPQYTLLYWRLDISSGSSTNRVSGLEVKPILKFRSKPCTNCTGLFVFIPILQSSFNPQVHRKTLCSNAFACMLKRPNASSPRLCQVLFNQSDSDVISNSHSIYEIQPELLDLFVDLRHFFVILHNLRNEGTIGQGEQLRTHRVIGLFHVQKYWELGALQKNYPIQHSIPAHD